MDLSILNKQQQEAVLTTEGPLLVLAGAGSGKTRVLTHRIAYLIEEKGVSPYAILALTFTNKAAGEMRERVEKLIGMSASDMWVMTFHSFCARILRMEIERLGYSKSFVIYDDADSQSLIKKVIKDLNINDKVFPPRALLSRISDAKNHSLHPDVYLREAYEPQQVLDAYHLYQKQLRLNNAVDFDDLLLLTFRLFEECPDVLEKYQRRFRYILVDEYQDTNMTQYRITELLARQHQNLCVVGDDDQSIYAWRGADIRNILEFEKNFDNVHVIRLEQNYRSTDRILDCANAVISNNRARKQKTLWTGRTGGAPIALYEAIDERDEANYICSRILEGVRGGRSYDDYAILYRTHAQSRQIEMQLKGYDIPYRVYGGTSFFQRAEVKDVLAYLRLMHNPADNIAFLRIVNVPRRGIGQVALDALQAYADENDMPLFSAAASAEGIAPKAAAKFRAFTELILGVYQDIALHPLGNTTETLLAAIGYDAYLREDRKENYESRAEVVRELIGYIHELTDGIDAANVDPLAILLENVALFATADNIDEHNGSVSLMTLHSAKGLEFPSVFLTGLEEGLFPSSQSRFEPEKLEEERRLCYVGVTRAKDDLCLTYARQRMLYGKITPAGPSCFLTEMASSLPESTRPVMPKKPKVTEYAASPAPMHTLTKPARGASSVPVSPVFAASVPPKNVDLSANQKVRHKTFGDGTVLSVTGSGNNQIVEISFFSGITKKFAAAYAPIETVE